MKSIKTLLVISTVLANVSMAYAEATVAVISASSGKVLINKGKGFVPAASMISLNVGDTVMIGKDASAAISYNVGCTVNAASSSVVTVAAKAPCATGKTAMTSDSVFITPAADLDPVIVPFPIFPVLLGVTIVGTTTCALLRCGPFKKKNNSTSAPVTIDN